MVYQDIPEDFNPLFKVVSCFFQCDGKILLLHRHENKSEGNRWGVPAGKVKSSENELSAMLRELKEETGYLAEDGGIDYLTKVYVKYPEYHFVYYIYKTKLKNQPNIKISEREHKDFCWTTPVDALKLDLVRGLDECIKMFYPV